ENDSLEPFLSTEKDGTQRGTYVLMADGSVRYIKKGMSDNVFQALASVKAPLPSNFKIDDAAPPATGSAKATPGAKKEEPKKAPKANQSEPEEEEPISFLDDALPQDGWKTFQS